MTNTAKHTPGPWVNSGIYIYANFPDSGSPLVAQTGNLKSHCDILDKETQEANARLIATAPETAAERDRLKESNAELLEALKAIAEACRREDVDARQVAHNIATTAITKAEGK